LDRRQFWSAVVQLDSDEIHEQLLRASLDYDDFSDERFDATSVLATSQPDVAFDIAVQHLGKPQGERADFVSLLLELDVTRAVPLLVEQAVQERQTEILWTIARSLRSCGPIAEPELRSRFGSPDFKMRRVAIHVAGWLGPGFLEADLLRMLSEELDDDIQWECLQALDRQHKERCVLELMEAFRLAQGIVRWSYLESILELGDPRLMVTESDPLWLGRIVGEEQGVFEVHAEWRLKERFEKVKALAKSRDDRMRE